MEARMRLSKNFPKRCATGALAAMMLACPAFAANEQAEAPDVSESAIVEPAKVGLKEVPVSQTEASIDGKQTLTKVFEVSPDFDPEQLKEDGLQLNGYVYNLTSFTKEIITKEAHDSVTQEQTIELTSKKEEDATLEALKKMPAFVDYDEDGYKGRLYPMTNTLEVSETGRSSHSGTHTQTRTGTCEYNDDSLVPATISVSGTTYSRSSIKWTEGSFGEDTTIPDNYNYTAVYTKGYTYSTVDGYIAKMTYSGQVDLDNPEMVRYTLVYTGQKSGFGGSAVEMFPWILGICAAGGAGVGGTYYVMTKKKREGAKDAAVEQTGSDQ